MRDLNREKFNRNLYVREQREMNKITPAISSKKEKPTWKIKEKIAELRKILK